MTTTYQAGKAPSGAPWTWVWYTSADAALIFGVDEREDSWVEDRESANAICRAAHEAQVMRAALEVAQHQLETLNKEHAHAALCNGVHAGDYGGACEGEYFYGVTMDTIDKALSEFPK